MSNVQLLRFRELPSSNYNSNAAIGTAAATVDQYDGIVIPQTSVNITQLTIPSPTDTTPGRVFRVRNSGNESFGIAFSQVFPGCSLEFVWTGTVWKQLGHRIGWAGNANGAFATRTAICAGLEFSMNTSSTGATCFIKARIIDTATHSTSFNTSSIWRKTASSVSTSGGSNNPTITTSYLDISAGSVALDGNYTQISVRLDKRSVTGSASNGAWMIEASDSGSIDLQLNVSYFGGA
jgi:hypothetical protein